MDAEQFVFDTLKADAAVTAIVSGNITAIMQEQKIKPPAVTLQRITTTYSSTLCVTDKVSAFAFMRVDSWALSMAEANALFKAVRSALLKIGADIMNRSGFRDPVSKYYRVSADFRLMEDD